MIIGMLIGALVFGVILTAANQEPTRHNSIAKVIGQFFIFVSLGGIGGLIVDALV